jgi:hypothetical protein
VNVQLPLQFVPEVFTGTVPPQLGVAGPSWSRRPCGTLVGFANVIDPPAVTGAWSGDQ